MSANVPISGPGITAPTPQNTPLNQGPIALGLSRPTVPAISEDGEEGASDEPMENITTEGALSGIEQHMLGLVQGKLAGLLGKSSGYIEGLPLDVKLNVEGLKGVQVKQNELQNKYKRECLELEKKYLELQKPLYERRNAIIIGASAASPEEIAAGEAAAIKEDESYTPLVKDVPPSSTGIPEFWFTALRNHMALSELITERDSAALKHLVDVRLEYLTEEDEVKMQGKPGFKILFEFSPNDFFENKILEKTYLYQEEVGYSGDFIYDHAIGTKIQWKEDKDLTKEFEIKKQRNKNTNRTRLVRKAHPTASFFNFFSPPVPPTDEGIENGEYEDDEVLELEAKLEIDYQIGEDLKEKIIPRAVDYFTGKALEYEVDEDEDDDGGDDDDEDDDEFDDDSDSSDEVPVRRRGPQKGRPQGATTGTSLNPDECKQQ
ncbi:NAP-domain-containing protein [Phlegmacium glaucopus]|nr:NAP-domain-containing protein [Phlegmacium glaucopus]